jgi:hypothetical protein
MLTSGDHKTQRETHPMPRGDLLAVLRYTMPTRPLLDLSATMWHTEYSDTLCSVTSQILSRWYGANHLHQAGPLPQKRSVDELPESLSRMCSCLSVGGAYGAPLHGVLHSARAPS